MGKKKSKEEVEFEIDDDPKKGPSIISRLISSIKDSFGGSFGDHSLRKSAPMTFNLGVAIILFFAYLSITIVCIPSQPQLLIVLVPTVYILIRYIKLERESRNR